MIRNLGDLLEEFLAHNRAILDKDAVAHAPTIGTMYEGLTAEVLNRALPFKDRGVAVHTGFIIDSDGESSLQLDCMITIGDGEVIPFTQSRRFSIGDVLAVVEVKKNLYTPDLSDAYDNLVSVGRLRHFMDRNAELYMQAHINILGQRPRFQEENERLPVELHPIRETLMNDATSPARIIFGYHGFAGEFGLRRGFKKFVEGKIGSGDYANLAPAFMPSLIICRQASLVKTNGMPFGGPLSNGLWDLYGSYPAYPLRMLLEIICDYLTLNIQNPPVIPGRSFAGTGPRRMSSAKQTQSSVYQRAT